MKIVQVKIGTEAPDSVPFKGCSLSPLINVGVAFRKTALYSAATYLRR